MSWFKQFMDETVALYNTEQKQYLTVESNPRVASFLDEHDLTSTKLGIMGEDYVKLLLRGKQYLVFRSAGSRSPADVWGIHVEGDIIHIPLIQVKTTGENDKPAQLSEEDHKELNKLASYVYDRFLESELVPEKHKNEEMRLIVSTGYAGVVFDDNLDPMLYEPYYNGCYYTNGLNEQELKKILAKFHKLQ
ncbi:hypothetical protein HZA73_03710 [candidate division TA06 bacterium]|nr:hypothetical protein [candidate division TA06 bacterium]